MARTIRMIFPVPMSEHTRAMVESQVPPSLVGAGFEVDFVGSKRLMTLADSYTTMHQSHRYLAETLPVPVVNPGLVAYKLCEMFLELGLTHSKRAYPSPAAPQDGALFAR